MGGSGTTIVGIILLFVGTLVAIVLLKDGSREIETKQIVPLPQIGGGPLRHGPWPGCLGLDATKCQNMIESYATDTKGHIEIITPEMVESIATKDDFSTHRVKIFVDDDDIVIQIPLRG